MCRIVIPRPAMPAHAATMQPRRRRPQARNCTGVRSTKRSPARRSALRHARSCGSGATCATTTTRRCYHALEAAAARLLRVRLRPRDPRCAARPRDRRVEFIRDSVGRARRRACAARGGALIVRHARARDAMPQLAARAGRPGACTPITTTSRRRAIATPRCARARRSVGIALHTHKDQVIFERDEVLTQSGKPFSVFTPYKNAWLKKLDALPPDRRIRSTRHADALPRRRPRVDVATSRRWRRSASPRPTCAR